MLLGRLQSGEKVVRAGRTLLTREGLDELVCESLPHIESRGRPRIVKQVNFRRIVGLNPLVKTTPEDQIVYAVRLGGEFPCRFVKNREPEPTTLIGLFLQKYPGRDVYWVDTAYTGRLKRFTEPNEGDRLARKEDRENAKKYWATHAFVYDATKITLSSETAFCPW